MHFGGPFRIKVVNPLQRPDQSDDMGCRNASPGPCSQSLGLGLDQVYWKAITGCKAMPETEHYLDSMKSFKRCIHTLPIITVSNGRMTE